MIDDRTRRAVESSDTDELVRIVDGHAAARSWEGMAEVRRRCDEAQTRGKQLWGVTEYVRYRLALDAPGEWAGPAVSEGRTRFTIGPLPEVAASTKTWAELEPHLAPGPERTMTAYERVLRGEDLVDAVLDPLFLELPLAMQSWEPAYELATYKPDRVETATPKRPDTNIVGVEAGTPIDDDGRRALLSVVEHWVETSNGRAQAVCVEGPAAAAVGALGVSRAGIAGADPTLALAWVAWAASVGGAHGRRRGAAAGRFSAWWLGNELARLDWPPDPTELGDAVAELGWFLWSDGSPDTGWSLRVAVESPADGLSWALSAVDAE